MNETVPIFFTLVVDNFGVRYMNKQDTENLLQVLHEKYTVTDDWSGKLYIGISLEWDYSMRTLDISMPGYVKKALELF